MHSLKPSWDKQGYTPIHCAPMLEGYQPLIQMDTQREQQSITLNRDQLRSANSLLNFFNQMFSSSTIAYPCLVIFDNNSYSPGERDMNSLCWDFLLLKQIPVTTGISLPVTRRSVFNLHNNAVLCSLEPKFKDGSTPSWAHSRSSGGCFCMLSSLEHPGDSSGHLAMEWQLQCGVVF